MPKFVDEGHQFFNPGVESKQGSVTLKEMLDGVVISHSPQPDTKRETIGGSTKRETYADTTSLGDL